MPTIVKIYQRSPEEAHYYDVAVNQLKEEQERATLAIALNIGSISKQRVHIENEDLELRAEQLIIADIGNMLGVLLEKVASSQEPTR